MSFCKIRYNEIKKEEPQKPQKAEVKNEPQRAASGVKALRCWAEVVERVSKTDRMAASFLKTSRAYASADALTVKVENDFAKSMVERPNILAAITAAVASLAGKNYAVSVEVGTFDSSDVEEFTDEILDSAEEM